MHYIGSHTSISGGLSHAPEEAHNLGATAFAMFTKNQRRWSSPALTESQITEFKTACRKFGYTPDMILPHDSYLINLGNPDKEKREKSLRAFIDEMQRCAALSLSTLNFHPGAHLKQLPLEEELSLIAEMLSIAMAEVPGVMPVIETTAGQGSNVGFRFEHIRDIISECRNPERVGVCIDTCHIFAAGYDLSSETAAEHTFELFDSVIGFDTLRGVHLNDSKTPLNSRVDRHAPLGEGYIGSALFSQIVQDPRFERIPLILETPDRENWKTVIGRLKDHAR